MLRPPASPFCSCCDARTSSGKRIVSAGLAAPDSSADVTSADSKRIRQSTLGESYRCTKFRTFCVDAVTESATAVIGALVMFHVQTPDAQPNSFSSKMFGACHGTVIVTMRKKQLTIDKATHCRTISRNVRGTSSETDPCACLGSCVPGGVAGTTTTKFPFPKKMETTRDDDPKDQYVLGVKSSSTNGGSRSHDTGNDCFTKLDPVARPLTMWEGLYGFALLGRLRTILVLKLRRRQRNVQMSQTVTQHLNRVQTLSVHRTPPSSAVRALTTVQARSASVPRRLSISRAIG